MSVDLYRGSARQPYRSSVGLTPNIDIDGLLCNLSSAFNPLHRDCLLDYHVAAIDSNQVCMSVVMPNEMLRSFTQLLESLGGFFRVVNHKSRATLAAVKVHDLDQIAERDQLLEARRQQVVKLFDHYHAEGNSMSESIRLTNNVLKTQQCTWSNRYIVERLLRSMGRLKGHKSGRGDNGSRVGTVKPPTNNMGAVTPKPT